MKRQETLIATPHYRNTEQMRYDSRCLLVY